MSISPEMKHRLMADMPRKLGKYEVMDIVGRGAMGVVYLGYDPFADRKVAIKVHVIDQEDEHTIQLYRRMFFNEAHMAGLLDHANVLSVFDAGVEGELPYIVMEYVQDARTLKDYCSVDALLPLKRAVEVIFKCAKALDYAHRMGVIHRDVKPTNIMFTVDDDIKIGDFGIAKRTHSDTTQVMGMIGSPRYMSPEQAQEEEVNNQTDLFSLGIVFYELVSGRLPFEAQGFSRLMHKIINEEPTPIDHHRADVPARLREIIMRCLEKDLDKRYKTGAELAVDLARSFDDLERIDSEIDNEEKFTAIKNLSFFKDFTDTEIWEVIRAATWERFFPGDMIVSEGASDQAFYIIVSGRVTVTKHKHVLGNLTTGDCFGEMGPLTKDKRTANIVCANDVDVIKVNSTLIDRTSVNCQLKFLKIFLRTLIERLALTNQALVDH